MVRNNVDPMHSIVLSKLRDVIKAEGFETGEEDIIRLLAIHNKYHKTDKEFN